MHVIIAGSRDITDFRIISQAIHASGFSISSVISGAARSVDQLGERWAKEHGIPVLRMPAEWNRFGRSAGFRRNEDMAGIGDALIAIWDGKSCGTRHMIETARMKGLRVFVWQTTQEYRLSSAA